MTRGTLDGGQTVGQGGDSAAPPARSLAAFVYPDSSMEELQPPGAAVVLAANPALVAYARAHTDSATSRVRFFWQDSAGRWLRVHLDRAPPEPRGSAVLVMLTPAALPAGLTPRELDVLTLMACGLSNTEISQTLFIGPATVKSHVSNILTKLDLRDRTQIVVFAYESGLVKVGEHEANS